MSSPAVYRFDDARREIVVTRPDLPAPWINYLSNGSLHAFASHAGGGCAWWRSPLNFRLSRYRSWQGSVDSPGFYLYQREPDGTAWSPTWMPTRTPVENWRATHAPGRSTFHAQRDGLTIELTLFVAPEEDVLVWDIAVTNRGAAVRETDLFGYIELGLLEWLQEYQWGYYIRNMFKSWWEPGAEAQCYLYHHQSHPKRTEIPLVYFAADRATASHSGDRAAFLGPYRGETLPLSVERGACLGADTWCGDPCAALQVKFSVAPGATEKLRLFLGVIPGAIADFTAAKQQLARTLAVLRQPDWTDRQRAKLDEWWDTHLRHFTCQLPDADIARQIETWTPVQCVHTGRYSRSISQQASGLRGYGFRDTAQDLLALAARQPAWAKRELLRLFAHQFADGHAVHTYFPEDGQPPWTSVHCDDHLWLPFAAHSLVAETGDFSLLDETVPFLADNARGHGAQATVWEHLLAAVNFTAANLGTHGLPLIFHSDWNDCIGRFARAGRGESVMAAQQYIVALRLLAELARATRREADAIRCESLAAAQLDALRRHAWDGAWWTRAFDDDGQPVGSHACAHGQIWLNSQSWSVLARCGSPEQQEKAMDAAARLLDTPHGLKKLHPSFPTYPEAADAFVGYSLGCGENGAIFCHANTWAIMAEARLGRAARAWKYFRQLVPHVALQHGGLDRYQAEPYAYVSNLVGPENPKFGWANVAQVTGTAAWMDVVGIQHLLGARAELDGLVIDPVLAPEWNGCEFTRRYRGAEVRVVVRRSGAQGVGVRELRLDGQPVAITDSRRALLPAAALQGRASVLVEVELE